jgi:hypothetical protein
VSLPDVANRTTCTLIRRMVTMCRNCAATAPCSTCRCLCYVSGWRVKYMNPKDVPPPECRDLRRLRQAKAPCAPSLPRSSSEQH